MAYGKKKTNTAPTNNKKTMPVFSLSVAEEEGLKTLTGLFENKGKSGNVYFSGKDEEGNRFYLFPSDNEKVAYDLSVKNAGEEELTKLTGLFENTAKSGATYWAGKTGEGVRFMLFRKEA